LEAWDKVELGI